jgi:dolichyl-phosphate-mannose--protein O-mannosyl transferase
LPLPDASYTELRILPRLAGSVFPLVMFGLARELGMSVRAALLVALLVIFENATQLLSMFVFIDIFVLLFGFSTLWFYLRFRRTERWGWLTLAALSAGCVISTKWTGLSFVAIAGCLELIRFLRRPQWSSVGAMAMLAAVPVAVYLGCFALQFAVIDRYTAEAATMTPGFKAALRGSHEQIAGLEPAGFMSRFKELNIAMFGASHYMQAVHAYGTKWYSWPFMTRGLLYWIDDQHVPEAGVDPGSNNRFARIVLLGNPVVWWASTYAILLLLINLPPRLLAWWTEGKAVAHNDLLLSAAYCLNFLPFAGIARVMFLYHYMAAFMFAILALCWQLDRSVHRRWLMPVLLAAVIAAFIFFAPLTYGLHLSEGGLTARYWFESWR